MKRAKLKLDARSYLSGKYGDALGVAVVTSLIAGAASLLLSFASNWYLPAVSLPFLDGLSGIGGTVLSYEELLEWLGSYAVQLSLGWRFALLGLALTVAGTTLYKILVGNVIAVGRERWYLRASHQGMAPPFSMMFSLFRKGDYKKTVGGMLWTSLWLLVWTLIPGLILILGILPFQLVLFHALFNRTALTEGLVLRLAKQYRLPLFVFGLPMLYLTMGLSLVMTVVMVRKRYSYRLVPYLLADNPSLGARRVLKLSRAMTRGQIGRMFLLDLSFLGWILLCLLCICFPWVTLHLFAPYYFMTWAEAYKHLRDRAASRDLIRMEELGYVRMS